MHENRDPHQEFSTAGHTAVVSTSQSTPTPPDPKSPHDLRPLWPYRGWFKNSKPHSKESRKRNRPES